MNGVTHQECGFKLAEGKDLRKLEVITRLFIESSACTLCYHSVSVPSKTLEAVGNHQTDELARAVAKSTSGNIQAAVL